MNEAHVQAAMELLADHAGRVEQALREDNRRLYALVRAKDETIGELLELIPNGLGEGTWTRIDKLPLSALFAREDLDRIS